MGQTKKRVQRLVYPLLELLPEKWMIKMKIIGSVLVNDWRMAPYHHFQNLREGFTPEECRALYADSDEETRAMVERVLWLAEFYVPASKARYFFFRVEDFKVCLTPAERKRIEQTVADFIRRTGIRDVRSETAYFHHGLTLLSPRARDYIRGKAFMDVGAYLGESAVVLDDYGASRIYSFEPVTSCREQCRKNWRRLGLGNGRFQLEPYAVGAHEGPTDAVEPDGEMVTIDDYAARQRLEVGFIKADVEGLGLELVKGAVETLRRDRPVLSIAVYHNAAEMFGIVKFLREMALPDYAYMLRNLSPADVHDEYVLLAVPREAL